MDWSSFSGGVAAALTGVFATVLVTEWIESIKYSFESKKALACLYTELADLHEECSQSLLVLQDTYYRSWRIEKGIQVDDMWDGISIPKAPKAIILESHIEKSLGELTKDQRKGIRTILHLSKQIEISISSLMMQASDEKISSTKVKFCMSVLCALYHLSLNMRVQEGRFIKINKTPNEVQESVLRALGVDLSFNACTAYRSAT